MIKAISLFSSSGIGELLLDSKEIKVVVANELLERRAKCYEHFYPKTKMVVGDITDTDIKMEILSETKNDVKLLIATPPCQGLSSVGKNKVQKDFINDRRNFLVMEVFSFIDELDLDYILIENVPRFIKMYFPYKEDFYTLEEILIDKYNNKYKIEVRVLNVKDYGVPQSRPRAFIKMYKYDLTWDWPEEEEEVTLKESIGHLPSLLPDEKSDIKWHEAKKVNDRILLALSHTESGKSAIQNEKYYPKKIDGERIKGFHNTYKRMSWENPATARTTYNGSVSSHNNVHPGYRNENGTYSDARVLSLLETFIVSSIPVDIDFPKETSESFIRTIIGEAIPPLMMKKILDGINR